MHIDNLVPLFNVANVADSVHFYCDILGFEIVAQYPIEGEPVWANLAIGNHHLCSISPTGYIAAANGARIWMQ